MGVVYLFSTLLTLKHCNWKKAVLKVSNAFTSVIMEKQFEVYGGGGELSSRSSNSLKVLVTTAL